MSPFARIVVVLRRYIACAKSGRNHRQRNHQITAVPCARQGSAARRFLIARAAAPRSLPESELSIEDGLIRGHDNRSVSFGELIGDDVIRLDLLTMSRSRLSIPTRSSASQFLAWTCQPRQPANWFMCDIRVPGMLHGRVVRPPYAGVDAGNSSVQA
jgi:nicotinate dehydrogenase subunit B